MLAVDVVSLEPTGDGWTMSGWQSCQLESDLGVDAGGPTWLHWKRDPSGDTATTDDGFTIDVRPFLGIVGLVPPGEDVPMVQPHVGGGNVDCAALGPGSTLYLPIGVPDAMLYVGDGPATG